MEIRRRTAEGLPWHEAEACILPTAGVSRKTLVRWRQQVKGHPPSLWRYLLLPAYKPGGRRAEIDSRFERRVLKDYLRPEQPSLRAAYDRAVRWAKRSGVSFPSYSAMLRHVRRLPQTAVALAREGKAAEKLLLSPQQRSVAHLQAMQAVNLDGHVFDVLVDWEDGSPPGRPVAVMAQDIYSRRIIAWRLDKSENAEGVRLVVHDMLREAGRIPEEAYLDNGRAFAAKSVTGQLPRRHRFKTQEEELAGVFTFLGIDVHWTKVVHGQSKPIERAFRDLAERISRHPTLAGAYVGNQPTKRPVRAGSFAMPVSRFRQLVAEEIQEHNAREGRRTQMARGRSFDAVFFESLAASTLATPTAEQLAALLLAVREVKVRRPYGEITLFGNVFYLEKAAREWLGRKLMARFDPEDVKAGIELWSLCGRYLGRAQCRQGVGLTTAGRPESTPKPWQKKRS